MRDLDVDMNAIGSVFAFALQAVPVESSLARNAAGHRLTMMSVTGLRVLRESDISARLKNNFAHWCRMLILVGCVTYQQICLFK
jgi:hypothetical protein